MLNANFAAYLVRRYGSPLYVYDVSAIEKRYAELRATLPEDARILYSLKANPLPALCAVLKDAGCAAELSSTGEMAVAQWAGFDLKEALYTGPGKTSAELDAALRAGVGYFSCESWRDLERLAFIKGPGPGLLLRVNPIDAPASGLSMSGRGTQFGFSEQTLARDASQALLPRNRVVGFHVYHGTQLSSLVSLESSFQSAVATGIRMASQLALTPRVLDLGGGFPWPFAVSGSGLELPLLHEPLAALRRSVGERCELWFEVGRFLVASCGTLVSVVQDVKTPAAGPVQIILDAGVNHLGGMSGLQRLTRPTISLLMTGREKRDAAEADVFGPLCTPLDCLARQIALESLPRTGDLVQIPNVGAYGLTASLTGFLTRPPPLEIVVRGECVESVFKLRTGHEALPLAGC